MADPKSKDFGRSVDSIDSANLAFLRKLIAEKGFPTAAQVGNQGVISPGYSCNMPMKIRNFRANNCQFCGRGSRRVSCQRMTWRDSRTVSWWRAVSRSAMERSLIGLREISNCPMQAN